MEKILQYMWQFRMWGSSEKVLSDGRRVMLLDPGKLNADAGPDFFNAKVIIDGVEWAGNVEVHVKASDWKRHGHHNDAAYDNIILHVVGIDDEVICRRDGTPIPQLLMPLTPEIAQKYTQLVEGGAAVRCGAYLSEVPSLIMSDWLETLAFERLQSKTSRFVSLLEQNHGDWEEVCYVFLARSLGFGLNSQPFEMLARSLPLSVLRKHSDSRLQLEALLFGQAGMLDVTEHVMDEYYQLLCREYFFMMRKYSLRPMERHLWKFARTRPANFPHRRIALLAKFCHGGFAMMRQMIEAKGDVDKLRNLFAVEMSDYWSTHSSFEVASQRNSLSLTRNSIDLLMINLVAPLYYAYGGWSGDTTIEDMSMDLLSSIKAESNSIISRWAAVGVTADNALRSQALLQLTKEYCDNRKCLYCRIGNRMLRIAGKK